MAFVDELKIHIKAGDGGDGVVRWRHEKNREFGGPAGGNGGRGGNIYVVATRDVHLLYKYRHKKDFVAENGVPGGGRSLFGADGDDLEILLPVGSIVTNTKTGFKISLEQEGEKKLLLAGGEGGRGNESFKSSTNRSPKEFTTGKPGEEGDFFIELELIADIGLIGFPSSGKTSLLNTLTNAHGKVGAYPFTTLEPSLGEFYGYIIADIPGLIEGASTGKGLGYKFLRHIRRTRILVHLVSLEQENVASTYKAIREELKQFDPTLLEKEEIVILTKTDILLDEKLLAGQVKKIEKLNPNVLTLSLYDDMAVKKIQDYLMLELRKS